MSCPSPETVAAMAEGRLNDADRDAFLDHAAGCDDCRHAALILTTKVSTARIPARTSRPSWIPWAAAAALAISLVGLLLLATKPAPEQPTVRTTPKATIPVEPPKPPPPVELPKPPAPTPPAPVELPKPPAPKPVDPAPTPEPPVKPVPEKPAPQPEPAKPAPTPEPAKPVTEAAVAAIHRLEGEVYVVNGQTRTPAKAGQDLRPGDGLECRGAQSWALVGYPDRTRVELEGNTLVREFLGRQPGKGLRVAVDKGAVKAEVAKQPAGQPMLFTSAHGEARVLGTTLRVIVDADPKKGMRLEVEEGKVELANLAGRTAVVESGHFAVAVAGATPATRRLPKEEVILTIDAQDGKKPALLAKGTVERGPDRRLCLTDVVDVNGGVRLMINEAAEGLFTFTGEEVLSFDYWVDALAGSVNMSLWNPVRKISHEGEVPKLVTGKWTKVSIRLADFGDPAARFKDGDHVTGMLLQSTGGAKKFYVDNLSITRPRTIKLRASEAK